MASFLFTSRLGLTGSADDMRRAINRSRLQKSINAPVLQFMRQNHGAEVALVTEAIPDPDCDAMITTNPEIALAVLTADCLPILVHAERMVSAIHVGRRGFLLGIVPKTLSMMREMGAREFTLSIGPSICGRCYEVSEDIYREAIETEPSSDAGFRHIDILAGVKGQISNFSTSIHSVNICTLESSLHYSYRRGGEAERQTGVIRL